MNFYRLSSFLSKEGKLDVYRISTINPNVFYLRTDTDESFILKKHRRKNSVQQQWDFFEEKPSTVVVPFHSFPNERKYLYTGRNYWTISPYKAGSKLNYKVERDRIDAVKTLKQFHHEASGVKIPYPLKKEKFYLRWYNRLESFKKTEEIFEKFGYESLYMDIVQTSDRALRFISRFPWERIEKEAEYQGRWIHGDVASHNFIRGKDKIFLIDFDLLLNAPPLYDYFQLGQRFLPFINWNLDKLLSYKMVQERYLRAWLAVILVPSDVLREWLHFLYRDSGKSPEEYLNKMETDWEKRKIFSKSAKAMLKS